MPSSPNYVRDYKQEAKTSKARGEIGGHSAPHAQRMRARRLALKMGMIKPGSKQDIDHKKPLSEGGKTTPGNIRPRSAHANRSYARNSDGSIKE